MIRMIRHICRSPRALIRSVLSLDDTPHAVALGAALGMVIGMTPTVGIQMLLVLALAAMTRRWIYFNRPAAIAAIYVSNPLTMLPLYWGLYWVGTWFVAGDATMADMSRALTFQSVNGSIDAITTLCVEFGFPLAIGTAIVAPLSGLLTYPVVRSLLYRAPRRVSADDTGATRSTSRTGRKLVRRSAIGSV